MNNRLLRTAGSWAALAALFLMLGGHWAILQGVAWTRMLAGYSRTGTISEAIEKTFDGEHPCKMCVEIKKGRQQERERESQRPLLGFMKQFDLILDGQSAGAPLADFARSSTPFLPDSNSDFLVSPPKPPPRRV